MVYTDIRTLGRKHERAFLVSDLRKALAKAELAVDIETEDRDGSLTLHMMTPELSALVILDYRMRGDVPLIHWHDAHKPLQDFVPFAWNVVNQYHRRKATSFPAELDDMVEKLVFGFRAAATGAAFLASEHSTYSDG